MRLVPLDKQATTEARPGVRYLVRRQRITVAHNWLGEPRYYYRNWRWELPRRLNWLWQWLAGR